MSSGGTTVKSTQSAPYTAQQKKWQEQALKIYGPQLGQGENIYPGQRVAEFSPLQTKSLESAGSLLDYFNSFSQMPLFGETGSALNKILSGEMGATPTSTEEAIRMFGETREVPARKNWSENVAPVIREEYAGPGYWGSARSKAVSKSAQDLEDTLASERSDYLWNVEQSNKALKEAAAQRALSAVSPAMSYSQLPTQEALSKLGGATTAYQLGSAEQIQKQAEINAAMQKFAEENRITSSEDMQILLSLLGAPYGGTTQTINTGKGVDWGKIATTAAMAIL